MECYVFNTSDLAQFFGNLEPLAVFESETFLCRRNGEWIIKIMPPVDEAQQKQFMDIVNANDITTRKVISDKLAQHFIDNYENELNEVPPHLQGDF